MNPKHIIHQHYPSLSDAQCDAVERAYRRYWAGLATDVGHLVSIEKACFDAGIHPEIAFQIAMERSSDWVRTLFEEVTE